MVPVRFLSFPAGLAAVGAVLVALSAYEMNALSFCSTGRPLLSSAAGAVRTAAEAPLGALSSAVGILMLGPFSRTWKATLTSVGECTSSSLTGAVGTAALYWVITCPLHLLNVFIAFNVALSLWGAFAGGLSIINSKYLHDALPFFSFKPTGIDDTKTSISALGLRLIKVPHGFYVPLWILISLHWCCWLPTIVSNIVLGRWQRFTHRFRKGPIVYKSGMQKPSANIDGEADWDVDWVDKLLQATPAMMEEMESFVQQYEERRDSKGGFQPSDHYELVNFVPLFGKVCQSPHGANDGICLLIIRT